ncbi:TEL2-interacting protein 1 [Entomortierella beljakovae]|nr:TEL2-interacting protein 1 [Entomortierella beljakovae]
MEEGVSEETMATFSLLQGPVSKLLSVPSIGASNAQEAARYLNSIHTILAEMPDPELHLTKQLIAYIQHSLNHTLFLCQNFMQLSKRFDFLVEAWCKCLEFLLRLPDGFAFVVGGDWRYSQLLFNILLRAVDGIPIRNEPSSSSSSSSSKKQKSTLDPTSLPKDKMPDETRLAALRCLVLALPLDRSILTLHDTNGDDPCFNATDRSIRTSKDEEVRNHLLKPESKSILGQMLVILLNTSKDANLVELRRMALEGVMKLLKCLETPERVAAWFPGVSAGLTESMTKRGIKEHHSILVEALQVWAYLVVLVLKDYAHSAQQSIGSNGLGLGEKLTSMYKEKSNSKSRTSTESQQSPQLVYGSKEWKAKADHGLKTLFKQISPLRSHSHWKVRLKFGETAFQILKECQKAITIQSGNTKSSGAACFLLETLIGCTQDEYKDVYEPTRSFLGQLSRSYLSLELINLAKEILRERLVALPRVLHGVDESVKRSTIRISQGLVLFMDNQMDSMINDQTLLTYVQSWITILTIEQLDQHNMDERGGILSDGSSHQDSGPNGMEEKWNQWVLSHKGSSRKFGYPRKIYVYLRDQTTSMAFSGFLRQLGSTTEIDAWVEELTIRLQQECRNVRENQGWFGPGSASCVHMMNQLLLGANDIGLATFGVPQTKANMEKSKSKNAPKKKRQKHARRAAKAILEEYLAVLVESSQMSTDARLRNQANKRYVPSAERRDRDKKFAFARFMGMEEEDGLDIDSPEAQIYDYNTDVTLQCLLLEGVACTAIVMGGTEFELELVRILYVLLEHLGDQESALVRDTAEATLEHVAFICNYDSIGDLIQANYDYVIQQVSQKIAFLSSNPKTPQVLWSLIRVVGPPAISMLEDSVTEIFEALDHWKNQEDQVGEGLLKSLCEIVKVMAQRSSASPSTKRSGNKLPSNQDSGVIMSPGVIFSLPMEPSYEVAQFAKTYRIMIQGVEAGADENELKMREETKNMSPEEINDYFTNLIDEAKMEEERRLGEEVVSGNTDSDQNEDEVSFGDLRAKMPKPSKESQPKPPSKHEALCLRILDKTGYFLTASSPRMRILALETIQWSIVVLKDRPQDLNPAIHAFWPSIVGRVLKRSEKDVFYVSLRAIEVVTLLAENCSEFLGRHLLDDIWPFILKALRAWTKQTTVGTKGNKARILGKQSGPDQKVNMKASQFNSRSQGRREAAAKVFTLEHRLQMTTLQSVSKIVRKVRIPVQDIWEILILTRDMMLDSNWNLHWDVRHAASEAIKSMAIAGHGDAVFLVLDNVIENRRFDNTTENADDMDESISMCKDIVDYMANSQI